jgi:GTP-binding protein Era
MPVWKRLSIITSKAQTTRHRILGIVVSFQMILSDTPGIIKPAYEMQDDELREISF